MKKILISGLLSISFMFANSCPDLSKQTFNEEEKQGVIESLKQLPVVENMYYDTLKKYNKTNDIRNYVNLQTLREYGTTEFWGLLTGASYINKDLYNELLNSIDSSNKNWCFKNQYDSILNKYEKEKRPAPAKI